MDFLWNEINMAKIHKLTYRLNEDEYYRLWNQFMKEFPKLHIGYARGNLIITSRQIARLPGTENVNFPIDINREMFYLSDNQDWKLAINIVDNWITDYCIREKIKIIPNKYHIYLNKDEFMRLAYNFKETFSGHYMNYADETITISDKETSCCLMDADESLSIGKVVAKSGCHDEFLWITDYLEAKAMTSKDVETIKKKEFKLSHEVLNEWTIRSKIRENVTPGYDFEIIDCRIVNLFATNQVKVIVRYCEMEFKETIDVGKLTIPSTLYRKLGLNREGGREERELNETIVKALKNYYEV